MIKVRTSNGYDYYKSTKDEELNSHIQTPFYNVVREGNIPPAGGYFSPEYICKIKRVPNLFNT